MGQIANARGISNLETHLNLGGDAIVFFEIPFGSIRPYRCRKAAYGLILHDRRVDGDARGIRDTIGRRIIGGCASDNRDLDEEAFHDAPRRLGFILLLGRLENADKSLGLE